MALLRRTGALLVSTTLLCLGPAGCKQDSKLAEHHEEGGEDGAEQPKEVGGEDGSKAEGGAKAEGGEAGGAGEDGGEAPSSDFPVDKHGIPIPALEGDAKLITPGAEEGRVSLRLALEDGAHYRVTTIGMLHLPLIEKPTGFAREEELRLSKCEGEAADRSCLLTHSYRNYEAEPPTGEGLEKEERQVAGLSTAHRIDASGLRLTETEVVGPEELASALPGQGLRGVHRFNCIRFPAEPVGEGATWKDVCRLRQAGTVVTRELTWTLEKLEDTDEGARAQLAYAGKLWTKDPKGVREGQVKGALYLWADAGEPHKLRERIQFIIDEKKGIATGTDLSFQFVKVGEDGETLIRTDGKAFEQPPTVLNDPRVQPNGQTRDAEHPGKGAKPLQ